MGDSLLTSLSISLKVSFFATLFISPLAIYFGWLLSQKKREKLNSILEVLITIPMMVSPVIIGYVFLYLLRPSGWLGEILSKYELQFVFDWKGEVLVLAVIGLPLYAQAVNIGFSAIDEKLTWVSRSLGYNSFFTFLKVLLPLGKKGILNGLLLCFARSMGEFGATNIIGGGISNETETLPIAIYRLLNTPGSETELFWMIVISVVITLILLILLKIIANQVF